MITKYCKLVYLFLLMMFSTVTLLGQQYTIVSGPNPGSNSSTTYPAPFGNAYYSAKHQFFISASELSAFGIPANASISSVGFNVTNLNNSTNSYASFRVLAYTTALSNPLASGYLSGTPAAQVPAPAATVIISSTGWTQLSFASPFTWNGTSNLVIETCFYQPSISANVSTELINNNTSTTTLSRYYRANSSTVCASNSITATSLTQRPVIRFGWYPPAPVSILPSNPAVCQGSSITLTANGAFGTVEWYQLGLNIGTGTSISVTPQGGNGSLLQYESYNVFNGVSSLSPAITLVQVNGPSAAGQAIGNQTICSGTIPSTLTLVSSLGSIQWQDSSLSQGGWLNITGATNTTLPSATMGNLFEKNHYRAVVTNGVCPPDTSNEVVVDIWQLPAVFAGNDVSVCQGDSTVLTATGTAVNYTWSNPSVINGIAFTPFITSNYVVTGIDANGCQKSDTVLVVVSPPTVAGVASAIPAAGIPSYVPPNGLVGYWPFSGNPNDLSGNGNNGVLYNGTVLTADRFGNASSAYLFDGVNDAIQMNGVNAALQFNYLSKSYTINLWVKSNDACLGTLSARLLQHDDVNLGYPASFQVNNISNAVYLAAYDSANFCLDSIQNVFNGSWRMLTMVMDNGVDSLYGYLDGQKSFSILNTLTTFVLPSDTITIGNLSNFSRPYSGAIDDIGMWNRALKPAEIQTLFQSFQASCQGAGIQNIQLTGSTGSIQWQSSNDSVSWTNISGANASVLPAAQIGLVIDTTFYRAVVVSGVCDTLVSNVTGINVVDTSVAGDILPASQTICSGSLPSLLALNSYRGAIQWQVATTSSGPWTNLGTDNDTLTSSQMGSLTATRFYRAVVRNSPCSSDTSTTAVVNVIPGSDAGVAGNNQQICSGYTPAALNLTGAVYNTLLKWQQSTNNLNWTDISGANSTSYNPSALTVTTYFRSIAQNGTCPLDTSNAVTITVLPPPLAGTIRNTLTNLKADSVCVNGFCDALSVSSYGGATSFTWQRQSPGSTLWSNVSIPTNSDLIPGSNVGAFTIAGTHLVRVQVFNSSCGSSVYSDTIPITVYSNPVGGTATSNQLICYGSSPALLRVTSFTGNLNWEVSSDNISWSAISGSSNDTLFPAQMGPLTDTAYYRAKVTNGPCAAVYSNVVTITIRAATEAGTAGPSQTICSGTTPASLALSGYTAIGFQWQWASNINGPWTNIAGATGTTISGLVMSSSSAGGTITSSRYYRAVVSNAPCLNDTSNIVTINVNPLPSVNAGNDFSVCSGSQATLSGSGAATYVWSGGVINNVPFTPSITATYTVTGTDANACTAIDQIVVTVNTPSVGGTASTTNNNVCINSQPNANINLSGQTGTIEWQLAPNPIGPWTTIGTNSTVLTPSQIGVLTDTTYIRAKVTNGVCSDSFSNIVTLFVFSPSVAGTAGLLGSPATSSQTICYNSTPTGLVVTGYAGTSIVWYYSNSPTGSFLSTGINNDTLTAAQMLAIGAFTTNRYYQAFVTNGPCIGQLTNVISVNVNPLSVAGTISASQSICLGSSPTNLSVTGSYTGSIQWQLGPTASGPWSNVAGATGTIFNSFGTLTDTVYYRATFTSGVCPAAVSNVVTIFVNQNTIAGSVTPPTQNICSGFSAATLTLSGFVGTTFQWQRSTDNATWTNVTGTGATYNPGALSTSYYYRALVNNGACTQLPSASAQVTVVPSPVAGSLSVASQTICAGTTPANITLSGYTGSIQWEWSNSSNGSYTPISPGGTLPTLLGTAIVSATGTITTAKYIRAKLTNLPCTSTPYSAVHTISVTAGPVAGTVSPATQTICVNGTPSALTLSGNGGNIVWHWSANNISWTPTVFTGPTLNANDMVSPGCGGAFTATRYFKAVVSLPTCNSVSTPSVQVNVVQPIAGVASPNQTICSGSIPANVSLSGYTGNIQWEISINGSTNWSNIGAINANPLAGTTIGALTSNRYIRAKVSFTQCANSFYSNIHLINVTPIPNVTVSSNQTICNGSSTGLIAVSNISPASFNWSPATGLSATNVANPAASPTVNTTYVVQATANGCTGTASTTITVNPTPTASIITNGPLTICANQTYTFSYSGTGANSLQWRFSGSNIPNATTSSYNAYATGTYTVVATNTFGCSVISAPVTLTVNPLPSINAGTNQQICLGDSVLLNASSSSPIAWNNGGLNGQYIAPQTSTSYIASTTFNNCTNSDTVFVTVQYPSDSTINVSTLGPYTLNGITYSQSGTYLQTINNAVGCDSTITLNLIYYGTGIDETNVSSLLLVMPNPSSDGVFDLMLQNMNASDVSYVRVYDQSGRIVFDASRAVEKIDLSEYDCGMYLLDVVLPYGRALQKLVIVR